MVIVTSFSKVWLILFYSWPLSDVESLSTYQLCVMSFSNGIEGLREDYLGKTKNIFFYFWDTSVPNYTYQEER